MKILITGANGFLGYYLVRRLLDLKHTVIATGKGECRLPFTGESNFIYAAMDFTDPFMVHDVFEKFQPETVVHAGAMTKADECEQQQWQAYIVNVEGTVTTLMNAAERKSFFVFVSTDFVFDGEQGMYKEDDPTGPVNYYGKTKLEAEEAVREYEHDWAIVRTVMVYGKPILSRSNILNVVKEKLEKGETYNVFDDQLRTPTYVEDLAEGITRIIVKKAKGVYHLCGKDILTPYEMACKTAGVLGLDKTLIHRVSSADFLQPAKRPAKTGLVIDKARNELGFEPISFEEGLKKTFS
ncbi:MAG: SDR family oxidoreductase [Chitinophagaceae bacterium]